MNERKGFEYQNPRPRNNVKPNKGSLEVAVGANLPFQLNSALFCCFLFCFVLFWNCEHIKLVSCCWLCFQILPPILKFSLRLATKFPNWLKIGVAWFEISSSQTFACHGLRWSRGWDRVEGNPAKNIATKFSDWLDCVFRWHHRFCFGQCRMEIFGRPMGHRFARSKFWFQAVVWLPKFWVGGVPTSTTGVRRTCVVFIFCCKNFTVIKAQQHFCFWLLSSSTQISTPQECPNWQNETFWFKFSVSVTKRTYNHS